MNIAAWDQVRRELEQNLEAAIGDLDGPAACIYRDTLLQLAKAKAQASDDTTPEPAYGF